MPSDLLRALFDPTAPLPAGWPGGALGAFLVFLFPIGSGIPLGVLMARDAGVSPPLTALLYFLSDLALAITTEPFLKLLGWLARYIPLLGRIGDFFGRLTGRAGFHEEGARGPLGLILVSFAVSPTTGRAAAAAAGHGFLGGWTFAILGDMAYFGVLMASTLWISAITGNDRMSIGIVLVGMWFVLPLGLRFLRRPRRSVATSASPIARASTTELTPPGLADLGVSVGEVRLPAARGSGHMPLRGAGTARARRRRR